MKTCLVVNASPLICLAKVGGLDVLSGAADVTVVPEAVAKEILAGPAGDPAREALEHGFGERASPAAIPQTVVEWSLGSGETAVLSLALETPGAVAVLDDGESRACARALGVRCIGTLGLVVRAALEERIPRAAPLLKALAAAQLWLDDELVRDVLSRTTGERWPD